jgi:MFS family permease
VIFDNGLVLSQTIEVDVGAKQALKSSTFWHIAFAFSFFIMTVSAVVTHVMPYLSSIGIARSRSSLVATTIPLMSIGGRIGLGWLGDKLDRRQVAAGTFVLMGLGSLCFGYASSAGTWLLVPFLVLFGIGYGGSSALRVSLVREYFGRTNFGTVFGLITCVNMIGNILGPFIAGLAFDNWGSYQYIWFLFAGLAVISVISVLTIPSHKPAV